MDQTAVSHNNELTGNKSHTRYSVISRFNLAVDTKTVTNPNRFQMENKCLEYESKLIIFSDF